MENYKCFSSLLHACRCLTDQQSPPRVRPAEQILGDVQSSSLMASITEKKISTYTDVKHGVYILSHVLIFGTLSNNNFFLNSPILL
jgi:hypothetical protein